MLLELFLIGKFDAVNIPKLDENNDPKVWNDKLNENNILCPNASFWNKLFELIKERYPSNSDEIEIIIGIIT